MILSSRGASIENVAKVRATDAWADIAFAIDVAVTTNARTHTGTQNSNIGFTIHGLCVTRTE